MAAADQGIMALPQGQSSQAPQIGLEDSYDAVMQGLQSVRPDAAADVQATLASIRPMLAELTDEQLDELISALQDLYENPENYAKAVADLVEDGAIDDGDLPAEYDPEFLSSVIAVLLDEKRSRGATGETLAPEMQAPQNFARGGIAEAARLVASQGRGSDTMLAHITPREARMLRQKGGAGTINPVTGLPEFLLKKIFKVAKSAIKSVGKAVKKVLQNPIGRIVATVALVAMGVPPVLANAGVTALSGGSLKDIAISAVTSYLGSAASPISGYVSSVTGVTNQLALQAMTTGLVGTGANLLAGKSLQDSIKQGLTSAAISAGVSMAQNAFAQKGTLPPIEDRSRIATEGIAPGSESIPPIGDIIDETGVAPQPVAAPTAQPVAAPTPAPAPSLPQTNQNVLQPPAGVPSIADSASRMGQGIGQIARGNFSQGAETFTGGAKDLFMPSTASAPAASEVIQTPQYKSLVDSGITPDKALDVVTKGMTPPSPGVLRTYGPAVAAGITGLGAFGGFEAKPLAETQFQKQMRQPIDLSGDPSAYYIQGLPGVQYDERGQIVGSASWSPSNTMENIRVATPSYTGFTPRYMNAGGIAALAQGGYPRKVGQISGPGTEKSDSIPAMLSDGEFVMTAKAVRGMGNGSRREGAKKMYALMNKLERNASRG